MSWALHDGTDAPETEQTASCAGFFANLCAFDSDRFTALLSLPPASPPSPLLPQSDLTPVTPIAAYAAGGFDAAEMADVSAAAALTACTDGGVGTPCAATAREHPVSCYSTIPHTPTHLLINSCWIRSG